VSAPAIIIMALGVLAALSFSAFFIITIRNGWVYRVRTQMLRESVWTHEGVFEPYSRLASYDAMMWRFWVWDVSKFLRSSQP